MTIEFQPGHDFFVGIDSDGCVFDSMEVKHKECFIPNIIRYFHLAPISKFARMAAEFVNLYSVHRGINRFPALLRTFELLEDWPEVTRRGFDIPRLPDLAAWVAKESKLANGTLAAAVKQTNSKELALVLEWSEAVNQTVDQIAVGVPPFPGVRESLERLATVADSLVVSATPTSALDREWEENRIRPFVARICGQDAGTKKQILGLAKQYPAGHTLMVGDAPGDRDAAFANGCLFFPINPGAEEESWARFRDEGIDRFLSGQFAGEYQDKLLAAFNQCLPATPPWKAS